MTTNIAFGVSKYGQLACGKCKLGPPKDERGYCARCLDGMPAVDKRTDSAVADGQVVTIANVGTTDMVLTHSAPHVVGTDVPTVENDPANRFAPKTKRQSTKGLTEEEKRAIRIARSKAWHAAQKAK